MHYKCLLECTGAWLLYCICYRQESHSSFLSDVSDFAGMVDKFINSVEPISLTPLLIPVATSSPRSNGLLSPFHYFWSLASDIADNFVIVLMMHVGPLRVFLLTWSLKSSDFPR